MWNLTEEQLLLRILLLHIIIIFKSIGWRVTGKKPIFTSFNILQGAYLAHLWMCRNFCILFKDIKATRSQNSCAVWFFYFSWPFFIWFPGIIRENWKTKENDYRETKSIPNIYEKEMRDESGFRAKEKMILRERHGEAKNIVKEITWVDISRSQLYANVYGMSFVVVSHCSWVDVGNL